MSLENLNGLNKVQKNENQENGEKTEVSGKLLSRESTRENIKIGTERGEPVRKESVEKLSNVAIGEHSQRLEGKKLAEGNIEKAANILEEIGSGNLEKFTDKPEKFSEKNILDSLDRISEKYNLNENPLGSLSEIADKSTSYGIKDTKLAPVSDALEQFRKPKGENTQKLNYSEDLVDGVADNRIGNMAISYKEDLADGKIDNKTDSKKN